MINSLKIVDREISKTKIDIGSYIQACRDLNEDIEDKVLDPLCIKLNDLKKIRKELKEYLEVSKIIKNNFKYGEDLTSGTPYLEGHCELEKEDRNKLKQWLNLTQRTGIGDDE